MGQLDIKYLELFVCVSAITQEFAGRLIVV